jgi:hypothetical protein
MPKTIKNIGLDVHKNSISIGIAEDGRDGGVRYCGRIDNDINQLDKVIRKLLSKGAILRCVLTGREARVWQLLQRWAENHWCRHDNHHIAQMPGPRDEGAEI